MRAGIDEIPGASVMVFDRDYRCVLARGTAVRENGYDPESMEGRRVGDIIPRHRWESFIGPLYSAALAGRTTTREVGSPDGRRRYLVRTAPLRDGNGDVVGGVSVAAEVTELRAAQDAASQSERRMRLMFDSAPIGMALEAADGVFVEVNNALCRMVGHEAPWLVGRSIADLRPEDEDRADGDQPAGQGVHGAPDTDAEVRLRRSDGSDLWVLHTRGVLRDGEGDTGHVISQFVDVSESRRFRERLTHLATHDNLTGLPNRDGFAEGLSRIVAHPPRRGTRLAVLFIDLDDFKSVNDSLGHVAGDLVLVEVAGRLREHLRTDDIVARFGGDEFVVLLTSIWSTQDGWAVAEQLHRTIAEPIDVGGSNVGISISIGLAMVDAEGISADAIQRADGVMYLAKAAGGGRTILA